ncbi:hypothetical protein D9758_002449 [Tetrapyrgos nigripes]|uniref:non-specific serine/threonine protein kinase n=1 Tax=Tetrapyrgos nigripes TaxID=182062 RepID=A0A8H5GPD6_9AGAR|nr:hypothetical protein D9758_002449 [Tetrapyrgos nigripes]
MAATSSRQPDVRVGGGKYKLVKQIGSGSFGNIYLATNVISGEEVAVKLEDVKNEYPQLEHEYKIYQIIEDGVGIPSVRWFGKVGDYNAMVMDRLGPSLENLFNFCDCKFSLKTVLLLADQMIHRIEFVHSRNLIHRDIKPDNFVMGTGEWGNQVNLIDFGLAKRYRDPRTRTHIPYKEGKSLTGTTRYASISTHIGAEQSRRDDLEALGYTFVYFLRGHLPWQGLRARTKKQKLNFITEKKKTSPEVLCKGLPDEFTVFLKYARALRFEEKPDYSYCRRLFRDVFFQEGYHHDYVFDWSIRASEDDDFVPRLDQRRKNQVCDPPLRRIDYIVTQTVC